MGVTPHSVRSRDLVLPLFSGIKEDPPWETFLNYILRQTGAQRVVLSLRAGRSANAYPLLERVASVPGTPNPDLLAIKDYSANVLLAFGTLHHGRAYTLEELLALDNARDAQNQQRALYQANISHARLLRVNVGTGHSGWLSLLHDSRDFNVADSNLLEDLAPHLALAIEMLLEAESLKLRTAMAEDALGLLGVSQLALDQSGRVILADGLAGKTLKLDSGQRPPVKSAQQSAYYTACRTLGGQPHNTRLAIGLEGSAVKHMLLRPAPFVSGYLAEAPAAIGLVRAPAHGHSDYAAGVVEATLNLPPREAALAVAISEGRNVLEAGNRLGLRPQTARTYSKRVYARTGANGQASLVRLVLDGFLPFS